MFIYLLFHFVLDPGKSSGSMRIRMRNTVYDQEFLLPINLYTHFISEGQEPRESCGEAAQIFCRREGGGGGASGLRPGTRLAQGIQQKGNWGGGGGAPGLRPRARLAQGSQQKGGGETE